MADSLLNHSWPSFSRRWMKRWSFKRGSECKQAARDFPSSRIVPTSGYNSPNTLSPSLTAEEEAFFGSMAEEREDASSPEQDTHPCTVDSSTEDLLSIDSALQGSEYYKDLEFAGPTETGSNMALQLDWTSQETPGFCSPAKDPRGCEQILAHNRRPDTAPSFEMANHYLDEVCACSCSSGNQGSFVKEEQEQPLHGEEAFPVLTRSMSTSRRHSWETPQSPTDAQRRFSLDASELGSDTEREEEKKTLPDFSPPLSWAGLETWTGGNVIQVEAEPLGQNLGLVEKPGNVDIDNSGKQLRSTSVSCSCGSVPSQHISQSLEVSLPISVGIVPPVLDMIQKDHVAPEQVLMVQEVLKELAQYHSAKQVLCAPEGKSEAQQNLTWFEFLSNESEESPRSDKTEKGTKVKRRLSNLRNRVTGSWQKEKGKNKDREKEALEAKERTQALHGHELALGTFSNGTCCSLCGKILLNKTGLQCLNCAVNVHKNCKNLLPECSSSRSKQRDLQLRPPGSPLSLLQSACPATSLKEHSCRALLGPDGRNPGLPQNLGMTIAQRGSLPSQLSTISAGAVGKLGLTGGEMDEGDSGFMKLKPASEDAVSLAPSTTESVFVEDVQFASLRNELETDAREFAAQSWSLAVEQSYVKKQERDVIKRQDVIYELMRTEMHHVRTLKIMLKVYSQAMREELQFSNSDIHRIFPCVDELLELHRAFLFKLKERRKEALEEGSEYNYIIQNIGDVLVQQFSGKTGDTLKEKYGIFCSSHSDAVSYYKELMQQSKKFQNLIKKISNSSIVRRLGIQECNLLVTQRIMKYPVLVERIIQNTEASTKEYEDLTKALSLIKEAIIAVDTKVNEYEKGQRLREIVTKMELKSSGKFKNSLIFRKEDMLQRRLLLDGMLYWKTASGRLKDILAVLLTDVLLLLQEKDQKYMFASMDTKPPVFSLQKLIVREVANEERAMFLISASMKGPEMYEIHTNSKEDRNFWMTQIRRAVESCPNEDSVLADPEEEKKQAEVRIAKLKEFQERLNMKDDLIMQSLNEKQQIYQEMADMNAFEDLAAGSRVRFINRVDSPENLQGESILKQAVIEVESLQNLIFTQLGSASSHPEDSSGSGLLRRAETFGGYDSTMTSLSKTGSFKKKLCGGEQWVPDQRGLLANSEQLLQELPSAGEEGLCLVSNTRMDHHGSLQPLLGTESELVQRIQTLLQLLLSLQAVTAQQDSYIELQKQFRLQSTRGNLLLEQERQRNFEKQREELANVQKLQSQLKTEQMRWERDCDRQRRQIEADKNRLQEQEEEARQLTERLNQEREELERQREAYQHDLERLRESQRAVEKERERLEQLRKLKKQHVVSGAFCPETGQAHALSHSVSFNGEGMEGTMLLTKPCGRASVSGMDYLERGELVRKDSAALEGGRPVLALKNEVPIHLLSATNQIQKQAAVQQQIPTKLAILTKGSKEKGGKSVKVASHRIDSSTLGDVRPLPASKMVTKEESQSRNRHSTSPVSLHCQNVAFLPELASAAESSHPEAPSTSVGPIKPNSIHALPPALDDASKDDVIFF
ncbi:rho guanine nucleotide exchange factor 18 isoform 2-T2 [Liasis olivaceus]